jgi:hypothetical protein
MQSSTRTYIIQAVLFIATVITTTMAGAEWMFGNIFSFVYDFAYFLIGSNAAKAEVPEAAKANGLAAVRAGFSLFHSLSGDFDDP